MRVKATCAIRRIWRKNNAEYLQGLVEESIHLFRNKTRGGFYINTVIPNMWDDITSLQPSISHRIAVINDAKLLGANSAKTTYGCCLCLLLTLDDFPSRAPRGNEVNKCTPVHTNTCTGICAGTGTLIDTLSETRVARIRRKMLPTLWRAQADARVHGGECGVYVSGCMWLGSVSKVKRVSWLRNTENMCHNSCTSSKTNTC